MKVSVLMTTYNQEKFVTQAIDSILMQETSFSYEIIISEDASSDKTRDIVLEFHKRYPDKIRLLLRDRVDAERDRLAGIGGKGGFVNGLKACKGMYVALLDGDDYWTDTKKLQKQVDFLEAHNECVICFHNATILSEAGEDNALFCPPDQKETSTIEDLLAGNFMFSGSVLFRRGLFDELPGWFNTTRTGDWALHAINAQFGKIGYLNEVMATYRVHAGGFWSLRQRSRQLRTSINVLDHIYRDLGFKYRATVRNAKTRFLFELTELYLREGRCRAALIAAKQGLRLTRGRHKGFLSLWLRLQTPRLYRGFTTVKKASNHWRLGTPAS